MKYAIFSDVHGNLHALQQVLDDIRSQHPDRVVCLGDVVGYGAFPNEACQLVREACDVVVVGNHDHAAVGLTDVSYFNEFAHRAVLWTRERLRPEHAAWLRELPLTHAERGLQFVHASPHDPARWDYVFSEADARWAMQSATAAQVFIGHTHVPFDYTTKLGRMINVGSAGQPRDGDNRAAWTLFDTESGQRELRRVEYDVYAARDAIHLEGLPPFLAERLIAGR